MKIYIDESGDFNPNSNFTNIYASIGILSNQNKLLIKEKQFLDRKMNNKIIGEIKGKDLSLVQIESFISKVILQEPKVYINIQTIIPNKNPIKERHEAFIKNLNESISNHIRKSDNVKIFYLNFYRWFSKISLPLFTKIELLTIILYDIFLDFYIFSTLHFEEELGDIEIFIDEDRGISKQGWISRSKFQDYFKNVVRQSSYKKPFPIIIEWTNEHPFKKHLLDKNGEFMVSKIFWDFTNFYKSEEVLGIQIADIVASTFYKILNNKFSVNKREELLSLLSKVQVGESHEFNLTSNQSTNEVPNPSWVKE